MTVSKKLIENVTELKKALNEISVYDLDVYTAIELYYKIANKLNEVIKELSRFEGLVSDEVIKQNEKLIYLLGEGLNIEVVKKINQMIEDGTMDSIINHNVFNSLNNKIDEFKEELSSQIKDIAYIIGKSNGNDDTLMFQEAIDKVNATSGGRIYIPAGTYYVNSLVINKVSATKIILQGQSQKTDYFNTQDETVKIICIGNGDLITTNIPLYVEGISFIGNNKQGTCIKADNNKRTSLYRCKVYGFNVGLDLKTCIHDIRECEITANNIGIKLYNSGDSSIVDCWINTNDYGVSYNQYCANSQIKGGKIEWNNKGISTLSGGIIISNIQFDYNKYYDINIDGSLLGKHEFAVYPDNIFGIIIEGNRFLGSGYETETSITGNDGCCIKTNVCSEIAIVGNTFTSGGRWAQDNGGLENSNANNLVGPYRTFIKCNKSILLVTGNIFNSQYDIPPLIITDSSYKSEVNYSGNRVLNNKRPFIWDYGTDSSLNKKQTIIYSDECGYKVYYNNSKPIMGTFNINDKIYNINDTKYLTGWICTSPGTMRTPADLNVTANVGTKTITLSRDIKADDLKVGDILYLGDTLKVTKISYKDSGDVSATNIPTVFVDKTITVQYTGAINFLKPSFINMKSVGVISAGNADIVINDYYKILNIQSDTTVVNITFNDDLLYDGFEILIRCAWVVNDVNLKTYNLGKINTITSSNSGWYKAVYFNKKFKLIQLDSNLN